MSQPEAKVEPEAKAEELQDHRVDAPKRFLNGWTKELENLFAEWADKAACYRWMHEKTGANVSHP